MVVYKVDRLTRSLTDFARVIEVFDQRQVSFVSVTQQFNTTTSMGRLTLNVLLSFAQFEREVTGERIRDKIALSKKKGKWMGGFAPLGYDIVEKKLVVNQQEAELIQLIFERFVKTESVTRLARELNTMGCRTKVYTRKNGQRLGGGKFTKSGLYRLLHNQIYLGKVHHKASFDLPKSGDHH